MNIPHNSLLIVMFSLSIQDWGKKAGKSWGTKDLRTSIPSWKVYQDQSNIKSYTDENLFAILSKWDYGILKSMGTISLLH